MKSPEAKRIQVRAKTKLKSMEEGTPADIHPRNAAVVQQCMNRVDRTNQTCSTNSTSENVIEMKGFSNAEEVINF